MDCSPPGSSVHGDFPGKNTGMGCHSLLQGIFLAQGSNPGLPHYRQTLYHLSHQGIPLHMVTSTRTVRATFSSDTLNKAKIFLSSQVLPKNSGTDTHWIPLCNCWPKDHGQWECMCWQLEPDSQVKCTLIKCALIF